MTWRGWLGLIAGVVVLAGCAPSASAPSQAPGPAGASAPRQGGVLRVATLGGLPRVLHPYQRSEHSTTPRRDAATLIWANLIDLDWNTLDYVADPRRSMGRELPRVSADGRTYTFTLREDLRWSDGMPITSADFLFAYENASNRDNGYVNFSNLDRFESFRALDQRTIEITLNRVLARTLAFAIFEEDVRPVPRHVWGDRAWYDPEANPEVLQPTVVSGAYLPKEITGEHHAYTRNPNWWGKKPNIDEIVFVNATPPTALELLRTRQVQWADSFPPDQFSQARELSHVNVYEWTGASGFFRVVQFNLQRPLLSDKRVREALVRAVNRADLVQYEDDMAAPQFGMYIGGNTRWLNPNVERYEFDLSRSRRLLQEAGLRLDGSTLRGPDGQPVRVEIIWPTSSQPRGKMAAYLQQQWREIGIDATVTALEFNAFVEKYSRQRDFDIAMGSFSTTSFDPDDPKNQLITGGSQNAMGYSNPRVDELFDRGASEQDEPRRKEIYDEIQRIVVADLSIYYMLSVKTFTAFDKKVAGVAPLKGGHILRQNNHQFLDWYLAE